VLALAVFFSLTGLFGFHVYLVLSAQVSNIVQINRN
jgi:heme/copper-type cytochrome/quinol oxidase subunit 3